MSEYALNYLRRTGRTTRMLDAAEKAARSGERVYVVFSSRHEAESAKQVYRGVRGLYFASVRDQRFDWRHMCFETHVAAKVRTFVDHHAIEEEFRGVLHKAHEFDDPAALKTAKPKAAPSRTHARKILLPAA